jgi:cytochrome P450
MAKLATLRRGTRARAGALDQIPGSGSYRELYHLLRDATRFFHERFERHGRIFRSWILQPVVFLIGAEANETILVTRRLALAFGRGYASTPVRHVFGDSIMVQDGDDHRRTRELLSPAVGTLAIQESAARVAAIWDRVADGVAGATSDAYALAQRATFDVAANVLTGLAVGDDTAPLRREFERLIGGMMALVPLRVPFGRLDRSLRARAALARRLAPLVAAARERPPDGLVGQLAHCRDADGAPLAVHEIVGHLLLLFWAGYDTTASAGAWVLHELARRVDWQARLRAELAAALARDPQAVAANRELPQLNWFLYEIERQYPSALFFPRITNEEFEFGGYTIPENTPTFYSPYMSHHDPDLFEHPDVFDPDRFDPARGARRARPALLVGFGGGPRVCLGKSFAKLQLRVMIQALLGRYEIDLDPTCRYRVLQLPVYHPIDSRVRFSPL